MSVVTALREQSECLNKRAMLPGLDVIILLIPTVDISLNSVPAIANDKSISISQGSAMNLPRMPLHYGVKVLSKHRAYLLCCHLKTAVSHKEDHPVAISLCSQQCS